MAALRAGLHPGRPQVPLGLGSHYHPICAPSSGSLPRSRAIPPPAMMRAVLSRGCDRGLYTPRPIAKACSERARFMVVGAWNPPDVRTARDLCKRHARAGGSTRVVPDALPEG